jgi:GntR family transcriptional repressor for pyruvate dehydrogenase complex
VPLRPGGRVESQGAKRVKGTRPRSADILVDAITHMVGRGECLPGDRIGSEQDLISQFGVSRAVVREALRLLERDGLVSVKPGPAGGIFCGAPGTIPLTRSIGLYGSFHDVTPDDLVEARVELEVLTARLAAIRATEDDLRSLFDFNEAWKQLILTGDREAAARANVSFHLAVTQAAHNPVFEAFIDALEGLLYETALEPEYPDRQLDYVVYSHEYVLSPIRLREPGEAAVRMRQHLEIFRPNAWRKSHGDSFDPRSLIRLSEKWVAENLGGDGTGRS